MPAHKFAGDSERPETILQHMLMQIQITPPPSSVVLESWIQTV